MWPHEKIYTGNKYCYLQAKLNFHSSFSLHDSGVVSPVNSIKTGTTTPDKSPICLSEANYFFKIFFYM